MENIELKKHFSQIDKRFVDVDENFTAIKQTLNGFEDRMDKRFGQMEEWLTEIARNMARMLDMHGIHESTINYNSRMIGDHERRIYKLERQNS